MKKIFDNVAYFHMLRIIKKRPLDINVETVSMCPLKCVFCCNRIYKRKYVVMDNQFFEKIVKQFCDMGGGTIGLGSMQSDFLSDPLLIERIKVIKKYKKKLWLYSTTPLLSCKKYSDQELIYILHSFDYLVISAAGYDKGSYEKMAGIDGFDIFKEQLKRVKRIIEKNRLSVKVEIAFRVYNKRELLKSRFYKEVKSMFYINDIKDTYFSWFGTINNEDLPRGAKLELRYNKKKKENCVVPNATLAVQANGKVVGCGCIDWLEKYVIGDCNENTLQEIWTSSKAIKFRNAFKLGKLPSICQECGLYSSMNTCLSNWRLLQYNSLNGVYYLVERNI